MKTKDEILKSIVEDIFKLDSPKIDESKQPQIKEFVISAVNGDDPIDHLAINANLDENHKGVIVFILTNLRLIKIDIGKEIKSNSFPLNTIIGIERNLLKDGRIEFGVSFQNGSFGLRYPNNQKITDFFQKIEQPRVLFRG